MDSIETLADEVLAAPAGGKRKPARWWIAVVAAAGAVGAMAPLAAMSPKTYDVTPFRVELSAKAAIAGSTQLSVRPMTGVEPGFAEAGTHNSPVTMRMTVLGAGTSLTPQHLEMLRDPYRTASYIRYSEEGRAAIADFGKGLLLIAIGGGAAGGLAVSFGRWQRIVGGAFAGALTLAIVGVLLHQTYDIEEFRKTTFTATPGSITPAPSDLLPSP